jgi:hypothetical protein
MLALLHHDAQKGLLSLSSQYFLTALAIDPTWERLQNTNVSEAQLAAIQASWQQPDFLGDAESILVTQRAV